jgi:hypothetical protein
MALSDLKIFDEFAYETMIEVQSQQIDLFNSSVEGTIVLNSGGTNLGNYTEAASFKLLGNMIRDRDPNDNTTNLVPRKLEHILKNTVKVGLGSDLIDLSPAQFAWIKIDPKAAGAAVGQSIAAGQLERYLNTAIGICANVIGANSALVHDASTATMVPGNFIKGAKKFGDRSNSIRAWVTHSGPMHDMWSNNIANAQNLFVYGNVIVMRDPLGKLVIMTDSPDLEVAGAPIKFLTLGLVEGAITVEQNADFTSLVDERNGKVNIQRTMQSEWSCNIGMKGYSWDIANGGAAPTTVELKTATNWDQYVTSIKDTAGVMIKTL